MVKTVLCHWHALPRHREGAWPCMDRWSHPENALLKLSTDMVIFILMSITDIDNFDKYRIQWIVHNCHTTGGERPALQVDLTIYTYI